MQHFYNKLHASKQSQTTYYSFLAQLTKVSYAEIKHVGWYDWGP